uniref:Uncharacterized protein n=1 Tax=Pavo cristatus TaxID=9049 RepID=A0A8C9FUC3_PAVCR
MAAAASPARELTQNPLQKTWEPYDNGLPAGHSAQRGGERGGGPAPNKSGALWVLLGTRVVLERSAVRGCANKRALGTASVLTLRFGGE